MGVNYFTAENAWKHLFFVRGLTADEFYTDGGLKLNIEQLTQLELKRSGYERVVFYDKDNKLYCYDDESFSLLRMDGKRNKQKESTKEKMETPFVRQNRGLKRGRHAHSVSENKSHTTIHNVEKEPDENFINEEKSDWTVGEKSGLMIKRIGQGPLHLGIVNNTFVKRQIDAYMSGKFIKTAVVINDPTSFVREFGDDPMHSLTAGYERMATDNENIMVFLYTDADLGNIYQVDQFETNGKNVNVIDISCPNVAELRNMLMYFKVHHRLNIRMRELSAISLALRQAMSLSEKGIRIKEVYARLKAFGSEKILTTDDCYELMGVKKPKLASEQLEHLIGMKSVKETLSDYNTKDKPSFECFQYLTASRLQPDLPCPKKKEELIHFVLMGNSGTGKTTVAKLIGQLFYEMGYLESGHVVETDRSMLVGSHIGETAILTRQKIEEAMGGVLFIDEAYTLKRRHDTGNDFGQEAIDTLVKLMDQYKGKFILVAAGYPKDMEIFLNGNSGLASRVKEIRMEDYTVSEMLQILKFHAQKNHAVFSEALDNQLLNFCENWVNLAGENWGNAREAVKLMDDMLRNWKKDSEAKEMIAKDGVKYSVLEEKHIPNSLVENLKPVSQMRAEVLQKLNEMTGLSGVKATIEKLRCRMLSGDMKEPGHYLFTGNPGTGKTTVARYMGQILRNLTMLKRGHIVEFTASDLMSKVFNQDNHGNFYEVAKKAMDGVLFIDEAYQLVTDTTGRGRAILDALLPFMENNRKNICVIVAGYEDDMEEFLKHNSGFKNRFTEKIYFENYSGSELCEILLKMLNEKGIEADEDYKENALRALTRYVAIHGKEKDFGNARYIRNTFLPDTLDAQTNRLISIYGEEFSRDLKKKLTKEDIPADLVRFTKTPLEKPDTRSAAEKIESLIGYESIKEELRKLLKSADFNKTNELGIINMPERLHWVLEGNAGTGKTSIANLIGQVYKECQILPKGHTIKVTRSDLVAGYEGQSAIKTRRCIEKAMGGILFIDEAYALTKVENGNGGFGQEVITELVEAMESLNGEFAVVCAGYPDDMEDFLRTNSGLSSRMKKFILEDYKSLELAQIFLLKCKEQKVVVDTELESKLEVFFDNKKRRVGKVSDWGNGREAENLLRDMLHEWMENPVFDTDKSGSKIRMLTVSHVPKEQQRFLKGKIRSSEKPQSAIDAINNLMGFDEIKNKLRDLLSLKQTAIECGREDLLEDINLHWVLCGNSGTGKTTVAKLIGKVYKEMGLLSRGHTVKVTRKDLVGEYVGHTAPKTQRCIDRAIGGVLFIDEAYTLKRAGALTSDYGQEAIDALLEQMSERNGEFAVIVAGYPEKMEVFLDSNPGFASRFEENFLLSDYTADELIQIFELKCKHKNFYVDADTKKIIRQLFENMIADKIKNWANGREAENLEKRMRSLWARNPIMFTDDSSGEEYGRYTMEHIPDLYKKYLPKENIENNIVYLGESYSRERTNE